MEEIEEIIKQHIDILYMRLYGLYDEIEMWEGVIDGVNMEVVGKHETQ